jgi:tetratricopeptide (TPR) repeat protein
MGLTSAEKPEPVRPEPTYYLAALARVLGELDPERATNREVQQQIQKAVQAKDEGTQVEPPIIYHPGDERLFLGNGDLDALYRTFEQIEQGPLRQAVAFLEEAVRRREAQGDLWPDGRLELGIAYTLLEDWQRAQRVLDEVIDICESGGRYLSKNVAMAA